MDNQFGERVCTYTRRFKDNLASHSFIGDVYVYVKDGYVVVAIPFGDNKSARQIALELAGEEENINEIHGREGV